MIEPLEEVVNGNIKDSALIRIALDMPKMGFETGDFVFSDDKLYIPIVEEVDMNFAKGVFEDTIEGIFSDRRLPLKIKAGYIDKTVVLHSSLIEPIPYYNGFRFLQAWRMSENKSLEEPREIKEEGKRRPQDIIIAALELLREKPNGITQNQFSGGIELDLIRTKPCIEYLSNRGFIEVTPEKGAKVITATDEGYRVLLTPRNFMDYGRQPIIRKTGDILAQILENASSPKIIKDFAVDLSLNYRKLFNYLDFLKEFKLIFESEGKFEATKNYQEFVNKKQWLPVAFDYVIRQEDFEWKVRRRTWQLIFYDILKVAPDFPDSKIAKELLGSSPEYYTRHITNMKKKDYLIEIKEGRKSTFQRTPAGLDYLVMTDQTVQKLYEIAGKPNEMKSAA
jgi:predicted transcriptional regulator